jgi:hypothetical protein
MESHFPLGIPGFAPKNSRLNVGKDGLSGLWRRWKALHRMAADVNNVVMPHWIVAPDGRAP